MEKTRKNVIYKKNRHTIIKLMVVVFGVLLLRNYYCTFVAADAIIKSLYKEFSTEKTNDLVYRDINEATVELYEGETATISIEYGQTYENVYVYSVGNGVVCEIGTLTYGDNYEIYVDKSGKYMVYAGENDTNITNEIIIETSGNISDNAKQL